MSKKASREYILVSGPFSVWSYGESPQTRTDDGNLIQLCIRLAIMKDRAENSEAMEASVL